MDEKCSGIDVLSDFLKMIFIPANDKKKMQYKISSKGGAFWPMSWMAGAGLSRNEGGWCLYSFGLDL